MLVHALTGAQVTVPILPGALRCALCSVPSSAPGGPYVRTAAARRPSVAAHACQRTHLSCWRCLSQRQVKAS